MPKKRKSYGDVQDYRKWQQSAFEYQTRYFRIKGEGFGGTKRGFRQTETRTQTVN